MSTKILLAIAFTCVVSGYNITSATIFEDYKTNITEIKEPDCQEFTKKINENIEYINRAINGVFNKYPNSELISNPYPSERGELLDKVLTDIRKIIRSISFHKGKHNKINCILPKDMISEIIKCHELLRKLSQIFKEMFEYSRNIGKNFSLNCNGKLIIKYDKQATEIQKIIDKLQELNILLMKYSNIGNYGSNKYINLKNILELVNIKEIVSFQETIIKCLQKQVNRYNDKYSDYKNTKNYHDNSDENNNVTRGNKKYIKYNIDPFDINNFDANNMEDIFKTYNRNNLQNNTFKEWNPNDINNHMYNEYNNRVYNMSNDVVQEYNSNNMYNNTETNINEQVNKIFKLKNNSNF